MFEFFKALFRREGSSTTAKERLRLVLLSDHISLAPEVIEALKADLLSVISRYVEIDPASADVTFEQREREIAMLASVPILGLRDDRPGRPVAELASTAHLERAPVEPAAHAGAVIDSAEAAPVGRGTSEQSETLAREASEEWEPAHEAPEVQQAAAHEVAEPHEAAAHEALEVGAVVDEVPEAAVAAPREAPDVQDAAGDEVAGMCGAAPHEILAANESVPHAAQAGSQADESAAGQLDMRPSEGCPAEASPIERSKAQPVDQHRLPLPEAVAAGHVETTVEGVPRSIPATPMRPSANGSVPRRRRRRKAANGKSQALSPAPVSLGNSVQPASERG